jgi:hypothetical protein
MKARAARPGKRAALVVLLAVEHHVFVDLVADQQHVGGRQQFLQRSMSLARPHGGAGVVRAVDHDGAGARRDGRGDGAKSGRKLPGVSGTRTTVPPASSMLGT